MSVVLYKAHEKLDHGHALLGYRFKEYFENEVLRKRPYLRKEWCIHVVENSVRTEVQSDGRIRFWASIPELGDRYLRVITLNDFKTIHNAFPDRGF